MKSVHLLLGHAHREFAGRINLGSSLFVIIVLHEYQVDFFRYLGTTFTNQNSIQEEIKCRLKLGNACYYSV